MLLAVVLGGCMTGSDEIEYRGRKVRLSRRYSDYEAFKNDPDNIAPADRALVQDLVKQAPVATSYASADELTKALFSLKFPGYGFGRVADAPQSDGSVLYVFMIEVPASEDDRYVVYRGTGSTFQLVDDFVAAQALGIRDVAEEGLELAYKSAAGATVLRRTKPADSRRTSG